MSDLLSIVKPVANEQAIKGFAVLMAHICELYTYGESSSVSELEAHDLAESALYVLGLTDETEQQTIDILASGDVVAVWARKRSDLESRIPEVMRLWGRVVAIMPPIRNIALRDTLESLGRLPQCYDTFFAAHEVPCNIDYPLSKPASEQLKGLDYVEAWLLQLLEEAQFLAQFDTGAMVSYLDEWCPDYRGLLINLYDPIEEAWRAGRISFRSSFG